LRNSSPPPPPHPPAPKKKTVNEKKSHPCNFSRDFEIEERWTSSIQETSEISEERNETPFCYGRNSVQEISEIESQKFQKRIMKQDWLV
jgi:hypothetical protein